MNDYMRQDSRAFKDENFSSSNTKPRSRSALRKSNGDLHIATDDQYLQTETASNNPNLLGSVYTGVPMHL